MRFNVTTFLITFGWCEIVPTHRVAIENIKQLFNLKFGKTSSKRSIVSSCRRSIAEMLHAIKLLEDQTLFKKIQSAERESVFFP